MIPRLTVCIFETDIDAFTYEIDCNGKRLISGERKSEVLARKAALAYLNKLQVKIELIKLKLS